VSLVSQQVESIIQIHQCEDFEMAWLEHDRSGNFHLCFRLGERKFKKSLKTKDERSAGAACTRVEENIRLLEMGRLSIPVGANVATFLLSDGKLTDKPEASNSVSLGKLFSEYRDSLPADSLEPETLRVARIHTDHIEGALGQRFMIDRLRLDTLQEYVVKRSKASGKNGKTLSATTIRKELSTFRTIWTWAISKGYVSCPFPNQNLRFPKTTDKPPFQTRVEIERRISLGGLSEAAMRELWDCLFLTVSETEDVLNYLKENAAYDFLYPMAVLAAHTGARRSELVRSQVSDFDFAAGTVQIHEKKRVKGRRTTRMVPLSPKLAKVIQDWFAQKRQSIFTFPRELKVRRERKTRQDGDAVTVDEATYHLDNALSGSKWENIRGWHIFRHSFISNCAAKGIDQRMIDRWSGHQTDEMRKRYTHLFPDAQREAMSLVFG
jgi:integrase